MIKIVLGILQTLAKVFFVILSLSVALLASLLWFKFFQAGARLSLDAIDVSIAVAGKALPESTVESLKAALNGNTFTATFALAGFTLFMMFLVLPFYLVKQFLLNLSPDTCL